MQQTEFFLILLPIIRVMNNIEGRKIKNSLAVLKKLRIKSKKTSLELSEEAEDELDLCDFKKHYFLKGVEK